MREQAMPSWDLKELLHDIVPCTLNIEITGLALDSRLVKSGDLFFACKGTKADGRQFIDDAIKNGAVCILSESSENITATVPIIHVANLSQKIGLIASKFYHHPSKNMQVVGITGTNGKTSCSHFIASALAELKIPCGVIGTLGNGIYGHITEATLTTPDAITLQKTLNDFLNLGAKHMAMEVSSHSIDQGRITGIDFAISVYTNLTRDHLDYHGTMEHYANTKKKLFQSAATHQSVINADDEYGKKIIAELAGKKTLYAYGIEPYTGPENIPFIQASDIRLDLSGIRAHIRSPWGQGELYVGLIGKFNLSNLLAVLTTLCLLDIPFESVIKAMSKFQPVMGRMQTLGGGEKPLAVVDYSHTPDALEKALSALRYHCHGKLYCVFGCGGDRDSGKRPMMAKIAEQFADQVIVTDDNPRTENAEQIFDDIKAGFLHPERISMIHDRAKAIREAVTAAKAGDCILIAGKGAETYQIIGKEKFPFLDVEQVAIALN
jgi:UDP-N-acetylmuramoyl-L-alanyl-D-glutamate--2,6-diaminopimelate ligase